MSGMLGVGYLSDLYKKEQNSREGGSLMFSNHLFTLYTVYVGPVTLQAELQFGTAMGTVLVTHHLMPWSSL